MKTLYLEIVQDPWTSPIGLEIKTDLPDTNEFLDFLQAKKNSDPHLADNHFRLITKEEWEALGFHQQSNHSL